MTEVEWTPNALDLLESLDTEAQERLVSKLDEAKDWTSHRLEKLTGYRDAPDSGHFDRGTDKSRPCVYAD